MRQCQVAHVDLVHACRGLVVPILHRASVTRLYPHWVGWAGGVDHPQVGNQVGKRFVVKVRRRATTKHGLEAVDGAVPHSRAV